MYLMYRQSKNDFAREEFLSPPCSLIGLATLFSSFFFLGLSRFLSDGASHHGMFGSHLLTILSPFTSFDGVRQQDANTTSPPDLVVADTGHCTVFSSAFPCHLPLSLLCSRSFPHT